jgi:hypothetical protein
MIAVNETPLKHAAAVCATVCGRWERKKIAERRAGCRISPSSRNRKQLKALVAEFARIQRSMVRLNFCEFSYT